MKTTDSPENRNHDPPLGLRLSEGLGVTRHWHAPRTEYRPCKLCGWGPGRGIHSPISSGPRQGEPWGHAYTQETSK